MPVVFTYLIEGYWHIYILLLFVIVFNTSNLYVKSKEGKKIRRLGFWQGAQFLNQGFWRETFGAVKEAY